MIDPLHSELPARPGSTPTVAVLSVAPIVTPGSGQAISILTTGGSIVVSRKAACYLAGRLMAALNLSPGMPL